MDVLVDDIGSFPLPQNVDRETFDKAQRNFCAVTLDSFKKKCLAGLDVTNYPQQYDGLRQVSDVIHWAM